MSFCVSLHWSSNAKTRDLSSGMVWTDGSWQGILSVLWWWTAGCPCCLVIRVAIFSDWIISYRSNIDRISSYMHSISAYMYYIWTSCNGIWLTHELHFSQSIYENNYLCYCQTIDCTRDRWFVMKARSLRMVTQLLFMEQWRMLPSSLSYRCFFVTVV